MFKVKFTEKFLFKVVVIIKVTRLSISCSVMLKVQQKKLKIFK